MLISCHFGFFGRSSACPGQYRIHFQRKTLATSQDTSGLPAARAALESAPCPSLFAQQHERRRGAPAPTPAATRQTLTLWLERASGRWIGLDALVRGDRLLSYRLP